MERRGLDNNEEHRVLQYYVANNNAILVRIFGTCDVNISTLLRGMLVEALENLEENTLRVRVTDTNGCMTWCGTEWRCHKYDLIPVSQKTWQYLLAVSSPEQRVRLAKDKALCEQIKDITVNDRVWYCADSDNRTKEIAFVKYIGPVTQLGSGDYFGLDLLVI